MAEENDELLKQRRLFDDFLDTEIQKRNTVLLSKTSVSKIKEYILGKIKEINPKLKKHVRRNSYILKTFVGGENVLCVLKNVSLIIDLIS